MAEKVADGRAACYTSFNVIKEKPVAAGLRTRLQPRAAENSGWNGRKVGTNAAPKRPKKTAP